MKASKIYTILSITLLFILSCNSSAQKSAQNLAPIKVGEDQFIYHYTSQEDLDTLAYGFQLNNTARNYSFTLDNPNSNYAQDTVIEIWSVERIKKFEDKIKNRSTFINATTREIMNLGNDLSDYCKQGNMKERLATIREISKKIDAYDGNNVLLSPLNSFKGRAPLDYFMLYGSDSIKKETIKIILDRIPRIGPANFDDLAPLLLYETSNEYRIALQLHKKNIDAIKDKKKRIVQLKNYIKYVAPEVVRLSEKKTIKDILNTIDYIYANDTSWSVKRYFKNNIETIFRILFRFHEIDAITKNNINIRLKKHGIHLESTLHKNEIVYQLDIDSIAAKAMKVGLLKNDLSLNQRYQIARNYCSVIGNSYTISASDVLEAIPAIFSYKSTHYSSGHLSLYNTPSYESVMNQFMVAALADIPNFYIDTYLRKNQYGRPYNILFLGSKQEGFVIKLTDYEDKDYNHEAISLLFNAVLKHKNIDKLFTFKENVLKHRYEVVYEKPSTISTFLNAIGKSITDIEYE